MIDIKDRVCEAVAGKIMSAEAAAEFVKDGDNVGTSGFTPSGYPKAVPLALAEKGKKTPFQINVWTGASVKLVSLLVVCLTKLTMICVKLSTTVP